jgi:hypothetical protein
MQQGLTAANNLEAVLTPTQKTKAGGRLGGYGPRWAQ